MVDFPVPFSPMMPVMPSGNSMSVFLNFLKLVRVSVLSIMVPVGWFHIW